MKGVIAVYSMKGGVGKSTIAANLAYCLAQDAGRQTLLWDIDAQGAAAYLLGQEGADAKSKRIFSREVEPSSLVRKTQWPNLELLAADLSLRHLERNLAVADKPNRLRKLSQSLAGSYDRIVIDCPPGLGEIGDQIFRAADLIVIPIPPTPIALRSFEQMLEQVERNHERKPMLAPVVSMVDRRKRMHREFVLAHPDWPTIPQASIVERMAVEHVPVATKASGSAAAEAFKEIARQVDAKLAEANEKQKDRGKDRKLAHIPAISAKAGGKR